MIINRRYRWVAAALAGVLLALLIFQAIRENEAPPPSSEPSLTDSSPRLDNLVPRRQRSDSGPKHLIEDCEVCPDLKRDSPSEQVGLDCLDFMEAAVIAGIPNPDATHLGGCLESTPLHAAEDPAHVRVLLEAGADPNAQDRLGRTPLHMAVMFASAETVTLLMDAGADPELPDLNGQDALVYTLMRPDPARDHHVAARVIAEIAADTEGLTMDEYLAKHPHEREMLEYVPNDSEMVNILVTMQKRGRVGQQLIREIQEMDP